MFKKLIALIGSVALMFGCASLSTNDGQQAVARIGVQYATLKVINGKVDRAAKVVEVADVAIELASGGALPLGLLEEQIRKAIPWSELDSADRQLVELLILQVREELAIRVGDGLIDPEKVGAAIEVLRWVRDAAALALE